VELKSLNPNSLVRCLLTEIADPPSLLYYRGEKSLLTGPCIAVVGTRRPSSTGIRAAVQFARYLSRCGLTVVSGLARGIDSAAHRGALSECGKTIAVLGHGLDRIYPPENRNLADEILSEGGCVISEYPVGTPPLKQYFPQRNRLISGLSLGTLVIEAADKSGSLITARMAIDQNRDVFAIPGQFDDVRFCGGHRLIQLGAKLVTRPEEILEELPPWALKLPCHKETLAEVSGNDLGQAFQFLETLFRHTQGVCSLSELLERGRERPRVLEMVDMGVKQKWIVEPEAQHYLWIGR
jgi:DNA processing protein